MLVTKTRLIDALWPDVSVTEDTLKIDRRAADGPRTIMPRLRASSRRSIGVGSASWRRRGAGAVDSTKHQEADAQPTCRHSSSDATAELGRLAALFAMACAGARQTVFVTGPAGVGKTALVDTFLASPGPPGGRDALWVARGPASSITDRVNRICRCSKRWTAGATAGCGRLMPRLRHIAPTWLAQMPWLIPDDAAPAAVAAGRRRRAHAARVRRFHRGAHCRGRSSWCSKTCTGAIPSTVDLLSFSPQSSEPARLLVIGTYRPAELAVHEHVLRKRCGSCSWAVNASRSLCTSSARRACETIWRCVFPAPTSRRARATRPRHTDGNPLFVTAVIDHMLSQGWILETAPGWALSTPLATLALGVPDVVRLSDRDPGGRREPVASDACSRR